MRKKKSQGSLPDYQEGFIDYERENRASQMDPSDQLISNHLLGSSIQKPQKPQQQYNFQKKPSQGRANQSQKPNQPLNKPVQIFKQPDARLVKESPQAFDNDNTFNEFNYNSPQMQSPQNYLRKSYENPFSDFHSCNQQSANFPSYQQRYASPTQMVP